MSEHVVNKPFECTSPGCKATFTNEDHLSSHTKRHEMSLLLPGGITISRSNSLTLGADLTPTPTRFIRIGEEVGLFQDLLKANPFDEQFRKAAEQNKAAALVQLPLPFSGSSDEPLNTPHVVHPAEGEHPPAKNASTPAIDTPQPRLLHSPARLGSPPPAHVMVTPCSPVVATRAPPAHGDGSADNGDLMAIGDDMEVEGPLDMRSPSVLGSPSVLSSPSMLPAVAGAETVPSPQHNIRTPTTLQSSTVSSTVANAWLAVVPPPPLRPRPAASTSAAGAGQQVAPLPASAVELQIRLSDGQVIPFTMQPPTQIVSSVEPAASAAHGAVSVREKLKRTLQRQERPSPPPPPLPLPPLPPLPPPPPLALPKAESPSAGRQHLAASPDDQQNVDTLRKERNRAAANRWRARKKRAQQQMANSMDSLSDSVRQLRQENAQMRQENAQLHAEVAKLKLFFIQHGDCDVTRGLRPAAKTEMLQLSGAEVAQLRPVSTVATRTSMVLAGASVPLQPALAGHPGQQLILVAAGSRPGPLRALVPIRQCRAPEPPAGRSSSHC